MVYSVFFYHTHKKNDYAKFWGVKEVYYGIVQVVNGDLNMCNEVSPSPSC